MLFTKKIGSKSKMAFSRNMKKVIRPKPMFYSQIRPFSVDPFYTRETPDGADQKYNSHKYFDPDRDDFNKYSYLEGS